MNPIPVADELVQEGTVRRVIAAPDGDLTNDLIRPVESLISKAPDGMAMLSMPLALEPGELEILEAGGTVWLSMWGAVVPFNVCALPEGQVP